MFQTWAAPRVLDEWEHIDEVTADPWRTWTVGPWAFPEYDRAVFEAAGSPRPSAASGPPYELRFTP